MILAYWLVEEVSNHAQGCGGNSREGLPELQ